MNKKGNLMTVWWFGVLAIVGAGIVIGTVLFYSTSVDIRGVEAEILSNKIVSCLSLQKPEDINFIDNGFDIYKECKLKKQLFEDGSKYFVSINLTLDGSEDKVYKFGNNAIGADCKIGEKTIAKYFPVCITKTVLLHDKNGNEILASVLAGSNNNGGVYSNELAN